MRLHCPSAGGARVAAGTARSSLAAAALAAALAAAMDGDVRGMAVAGTEVPSSDEVSRGPATPTALPLDATKVQLARYLPPESRSTLPCARWWRGTTSPASCCATAAPRARDFLVTSRFVCAVLRGALSGCNLRKLVLALARPWLVVPVLCDRLHVVVCLHAAVPVARVAIRPDGSPANQQRALAPPGSLPHRR